MGDLGGVARGYFCRAARHCSNVGFSATSVQEPSGPLTAPAHTRRMQRNDSKSKRGDDEKKKTVLLVQSFKRRRLLILARRRITNWDWKEVEQPSTSCRRRG